MRAMGSDVWAAMLAAVQAAAYNVALLNALAQLRDGGLVDDVHLSGERNVSQRSAQV